MTENRIDRDKPRVIEFPSPFMIEPGTMCLLDAFGVAPSLASSDFYSRANRCMTCNGVLVMNLSGEKNRYAAHIESLRAAFPGSIRLVPVDGEDNVLLFAFKRRQVAGLPACLQQRAIELEQGLGLDFGRYLERLRVGHLVESQDQLPI